MLEEFPFFAEHFANPDQLIIVELENKLIRWGGGFWVVYCK